MEHSAHVFVVLCFFSSLTIGSSIPTSLNVLLTVCRTSQYRAGFTNLVTVTLCWYYIYIFLRPLQMHYRWAGIFSKFWIWVLQIEHACAYFPQSHYSFLSCIPVCFSHICYTWVVPEHIWFCNPMYKQTITCLTNPLWLTLQMFPIFSIHNYFLKINFWGRNCWIKGCVHERWYQFSDQPLVSENTCLPVLWRTLIITYFIESKTTFLNQMHLLLLVHSFLDSIKYNFTILNFYQFDNRKKMSDNFLTSEIEHYFVFDYWLFVYHLVEVPVFIHYYISIGVLIFFLLICRSSLYFYIVKSMNPFLYSFSVKCPSCVDYINIHRFFLYL